MTNLDYSLLDDPQLLQYVFYPRADWTAPPDGSSDHAVPVEEGIDVFCRFYSVSQRGPSILYFHGNGEVACDYDWFASLYHEIGANLFVADYRGYGRSGGQPTFANTAADAHLVFEYLGKMLRSGGYNGSVFIMGRSLGSQSAIELTVTYPDRINGLILESAFVQNARLLKYLGLPVLTPNIEEFERASLERIKSITIPVLLIHGELDVLIPHIEAETIYNNIASKKKQLLTICGGDHNNLMLVGLDQYFQTLQEFIDGG